jgi:hypothetical protein
MSTQTVRATEIAGENCQYPTSQPLDALQTHRHIAEFAADVRASLTIPGQRELPSKYLYDELGSALLRRSACCRNTA